VEVHVIRRKLCSKDTLRLHVYSYVGTCITPDAQKNPRRNIPLVGRGVINPQKQRAASESLNGRDLWVYRADYSYARSRHPHDIRAFRRSVLAGARRVTISNTLPPPCRATKNSRRWRDAPIDTKCNFDRRIGVVCCPELERVRPVIVRGSTAPPAQVHQ
jgi:hypothetical protein